MQGFNKECGVIGEPSLKFKSVALSLPKRHRKFRAAPQLRRSMRNARTMPGQLATSCYIARTQSSPLLLVGCSNKRGHSVELTMSACSSTEAGKRIDRYSMSRQTNSPAKNY
ncbi:hypothetical protein SD235_25395 (plasmid) [Burkholderia cepacia]|uniref:hypothetical protein n=1 Tax=Burkholderia cepacia TaxID=292 RepID=UPI003A4DC038